MYLLTKKHAHRDSSSNFEISYKSYSEAFESVVEEALDYGYVSDKDNYYNPNSAIYTYDEVNDIEVNDICEFETEPDFCKGESIIWVGDFLYLIEKLED